MASRSLGFSENFPLADLIAHEVRDASLTPLLVVSDFMASIWADLVSLSVAVVKTRRLFTWSATGNRSHADPATGISATARLLPLLYTLHTLPFNYPQETANLV